MDMCWIHGTTAGVPFAAPGEGHQYLHAHGTLSHITGIAHPDGRSVLLGVASKAEASAALLHV